MSDTPKSDKAAEPITIFLCGPQSRECKCECGNGGPCEHVWDGEGVDHVYENGSSMSSSSCSRCGMLAITHSMWLF